MTKHKRHIHRQRHHRRHRHHRHHRNVPRTSHKSHKVYKYNKSVKSISPSQLHNYKTLSSVSYHAPKSTSPKKALLLGLNYPNTPNALSGCVNDVVNIRNLLINTYGFKATDIELITDVQIGTDGTATKTSITQNQVVQAMSRFFNGVAANDHLFIYYSGHGVSVADASHDETDGKDEAIYFIDNILSDDHLSKMLLSLPYQVKATLFFDCCFSGTMCDLPYRYVNSTYLVESNKIFRADIVTLSGCLDSQTSADAFDSKRNMPSGALTSALLDTLEKDPNLTWHNILLNVRKLLVERGFEQIPQLAMTNPGLVARGVF